ncbi:MAG: polysaccharide pyruvyl transferase family protein [Paludibacteraceae bacterium]|nr:polysaccharide pyruvyl transferase family protein [Paludibacteraceae bacterium]
MKASDKIQQLKSIIKQRLVPLINHDYWLLEVPYYTNVGDTLIWQGELDFLKTLPYKCKGMCSYYSAAPENIKPDDIILFQGGGNFGDLWDAPQQFRMDVVKKYPNNKIIFFPQTVWFEHEEKQKECAELLSHSPNISICARDSFSFDLLNKHFSNNILLVPDMAFFINMDRWRKTYTPNGDLLIERSDKELKQYSQLEELSKQNITISDWLPFTENSWQKTWLRRTRKYLPFMSDWYAMHIFRPYLIRSGIKLISSHKKIYSTRLHAAILSVLLDKTVDLTWFDNSYGKNLHFHETWLNDLDGITFIR